jgi:hypothetical protein
MNCFKNPTRTSFDPSGVPKNVTGTFIVTNLNLLDQNKATDYPAFRRTLLLSELPRGL